MGDVVIIHSGEGVFKGDDLHTHLKPITKFNQDDEPPEKLRNYFLWRYRLHQLLLSLSN